MSIKALNWVLHEVRTDGPSAQIVLLVVADAADEQGICRHAKPDYIAARSRQAPATVFRRLAELEAFGVLQRFVEMLPDGRRRYEIRLGLDREFEYDGDMVKKWRGADPKAEQSDGESREEMQSEVAQPTTQPDSQFESQGADSQIETLKLRVPDSHSCESQESLESPTSKKENPPTPLKRGGEHEIQFEDFSAAYPGPVIDVPKAEAFWRALTDPERAAALTGAKGYAVYIDTERSAGRNRAVKDAHRWLRDKLWIGFAKDGAKAETAAQQFTCAENSPEWLKWQVYYRCCGEDGIPDYRISRFEGRNAKLATVPRRWPPECGGLSHEPWQEHAQGSRECAAWLVRLRELPGARIVFRRVRVNGEMAVGLRVPSQWPPAKGASAAPETLMDAEDAAAFGA